MTRSWLVKPFFIKNSHTMLHVQESYRQLFSYCWLFQLKLFQVLLIPIRSLWTIPYSWFMIITISNHELLVDLYRPQSTDTFDRPKTRVNKPVPKWHKTIKTKTIEDLLSDAVLTGHICSWGWRSGLPYDPKMHNTSWLHQMAEEHLSLCPHPVRLCCHSVTNLYCPPFDT